MLGASSDSPGRPLLSALRSVPLSERQLNEGFSAAALLAIA